MILIEIPLKNNIYKNIQKGYNINNKGWQFLEDSNQYKDLKQITQKQVDFPTFQMIVIQLPLKTRELKLTKYHFD